MRRILPVLLLATAPAAAARPAVPAEAVFARWLIACDNARHCQARGFGQKDEIDLRIERDAGDAAPVATLTADAPLDPGTLMLDATPLPDAGWQHGQSSLVLRDPAAVFGLVARLRDAHTLTAGALAVPLDGISAALLRMDAVQGRPGTQAPLAAAAGPAMPPPAPPLPRRPAWRRPAPLSATRANALIADTRKAAHAALAREGCTLAAHDADHAPGGDQAHALDAAHAVVLLGCAMYAYQGSSLVYVVSPGAAARRFSAKPPTFTQTMDTFTEAGFDPATGTLSTGAKGRGLADCGVSVEWAWSGRAFQLVGLASQLPCGGAAAGDWPVLYRTR